MKIESIAELDAVILSIGVLLLLLLLVRLDRTTEWKFVTMLTTYRNGRNYADRHAFLLVIGFYLVSLWGCILILQRQMSEWFFLTYMGGFIVSHYGSRYLRMKRGKDDATESSVDR